MSEENPLAYLVCSGKSIVCPATSIFIKSESGDSYLYTFSTHLLDEEVEAKAALVCPEYPEYWCDVIISRTNRELEDIVNSKIKSGE